MLHHKVAGIYFESLLFLDVQSLFYFIIKIIGTMRQNIKILNGRMIRRDEGKYMFKNG